MSLLTVDSLPEWQLLLATGSKVFDFSRRLPDDVSRLKQSNALFSDDILFLESSWEYISALARSHGDDVVRFVGVDFDRSWLPPGTDGYGGFSCTVEGSSGDYLLGLKGPLNTELIELGCDTAAVFGDSGRWGIWNERNLCGVAFAEIWPESPQFTKPWFVPADQALETFLDTNIVDADSGSIFRSSLLHNYEPWSKQAL